MYLSYNKASLVNNPSLSLKAILHRSLVNRSKQEGLKNIIRAAYTFNQMKSSILFQLFPLGNIFTTLPLLPYLDHPQILILENARVFKRLENITRKPLSSLLRMQTSPPKNRVTRLYLRKQFVFDSNIVGIGLEIIEDLKVSIHGLNLFHLVPPDRRNSISREGSYKFSL